MENTWEHHTCQRVISQPLRLKTKDKTIEGLYIILKAEVDIVSIHHGTFTEGAPGIGIKYSGVHERENSDFPSLPKLQSEKYILI